MTLKQKINKAAKSKVPFVWFGDFDGATAQDIMAKSARSSNGNFNLEGHMVRITRSDYHPGSNRVRFFLEVVCL